MMKRLLTVVGVLMILLITGGLIHILIFWATPVQAQTTQTTGDYEIVCNPVTGQMLMVNRLTGDSWMYRESLQAQLARDVKLNPPDPGSWVGMVRNTYAGGHDFPWKNSVDDKQQEYLDIWLNVVQKILGKED